MYMFHKIVFEKEVFTIELKLFSQYLQCLPPNTDSAVISELTLREASTNTPLSSDVQ